MHQYSEERAVWAICSVSAAMWHFTGGREGVCALTGLFLGMIVKDEFNIFAVRCIHDCSLNGVINELGEEEHLDTVCGSVL